MRSFTEVLKMDIRRFIRIVTDSDITQVDTSDDAVIKFNGHTTLDRISILPGANDTIVGVAFDRLYISLARNNFIAKGFTVREVEIFDKGFYTLTYLDAAFDNLGDRIAQLLFNDSSGYAEYSDQGAEIKKTLASHNLTMNGCYVTYGGSVEKTLQEEFDIRMKQYS